MTVSGLEAGRTARRLAHFVPTRAHINTLISASGKTIIARARFLHRNNPIATSIVDCFAGTLIGSGFKANWLLPDSKQELRDELHQAFTDWTNYCDADGCYDLEGMCWLAASELCVAGEYFVRFRPRRLSDGFAIPLQLQFLPSEMLDNADNRVLESNIVRQGVEFNPIGQRVAYHFWRQHPGDVTVTNTGDKTIVPANQVLHVRIIKEAGQVRGLSRMAPLIVPLWAIDAYFDAEVERKRVAALLTHWITKGAGGQTPIATDRETAKGEADGEGRAEVDIQPGATVLLELGEDVEFSTPADVGPNFEAFLYRAMLNISAGAGLPYGGVSGDPSKSNFSNSRSMQADYRRRFSGIQNNIFIFQFLQALVRPWLDAGVLAGVLDLPGYDDPKQKLAYTRVEWIPDAFEWGDPKKEAEANQILVNMRAKALSTVIRECGDEPKQVFKQIGQDQKILRDEGVDPNPPAPTSSDPTSQANEDRADASEQSSDNPPPVEEN